MSETVPGRLPDPAFWRGRRVLLTGHTGFKGAWATLWLHRLGAHVSGLALAPEGELALFSAADLRPLAPQPPVDLRDRAGVETAVAAAGPEIVLHMAAQPLVRRSYREPVETFAVNVLGTVHLLEAVRRLETPPAAVLVVTTDKVYANDENGRAFRETDPLGGHDPYAASKAAAEIASASYAQAFLAAKGCRLGTARGGNVIGGGDFSEDRIVPDIWRAARAGLPLVLRAPDAVRPWQHVLDCLAGYFLFAERLASGEAPAALNFGPDPSAPITVRQVAGRVQAALGVVCDWEADGREGPREMATLSLDPSLARATLGWADRWPGLAAIDRTAAWYAAFARGADARALMERDLDAHGA